jgi:hypothetical protein
MSGEALSAAQKIDTGSPVAGVAPYGVVLAAGESRMEQLPLVQEAYEGVLSMRIPMGTCTIPAIVLVIPRHSGAICTVLVEILQAR